MKEWTCKLTGKIIWPWNNRIWSPTMNGYVLWEYYDGSEVQRKDWKLYSGDNLSQLRKAKLALKHTQKVIEEALEQ